MFATILTTISSFQKILFSKHNVSFRGIIKIIRLQFFAVGKTHILINHRTKIIGRSLLQLIFIHNIPVNSSLKPFQIF
jgi:hypothetical protein